MWIVPVLLIGSAVMSVISMIMAVRANNRLNKTYDEVIKNLDKQLGR